MTDSKKLREAVAAKGLKYNYLADNLGITPYGLQKKIENDTEFKAGEVKKLSDLLGLSNRERDAIFLPDWLIFNLQAGAFTKGEGITVGKGKAAPKGGEAHFDLFRMNGFFQIFECLLIFCSVLIGNLFFLS